MVRNKSSWANCKHLLIREYKRDGLHILSGLLMVILFAIIGLQFVVGEREENFFIVIRDIFFLGIVGSLGFSLMSREYRLMYWWNQNPITKKLAFLKSLPISSTDIVWSRVIYQVNALILYNFTFFFILGIAWVWTGKNGLEFLLISLVWVAYGLAISALYLWLEMSKSEKVYFISSLVIVAFFILFTVASRFIDFSLFDSIIEGVRNYGFAFPLGCLLVSVVLFLLSIKAIIRGLDKRELV